MSTPQTKSTPPSYSVHAPGTRSAAGKAKTPTAESAQKTSHSVDKSGAQADETAKFRNARKSVLKTDKNTPTEDFQNRPQSSISKEKASNTRSPLPKSEKESVAGQSGKKSEQESAAKSKAQSGSKVGQTTPQQSRLDFTSGSKLAAKSADKELVGRILASGDKEGARRSQGKISSHSEMLPASTRQSGKKPVTQPIDADELEDLLEDDSAKVQVTAQKSREPSRKNTPYQGTSGNKGQREAVIAEEDEEEGNEATGTARQANAGGDNMEESKVERKEYSVYEDWRILELVEEKLEGGEGSKATIPRSLWVTAEDPLTGRRLLDGRRTAESMRDRYKRYIALLDDVAKKEIKEFCTKHTAEEAKRNHCLFKKVGGQKQFAGISTQLNYDPERISRKTPYGTKSKKSPEKVSKKKAEAKKGKLERDFEEEDDIEEENQFDEDLLQESDLEDIEQVTQTQTRTKLIKVTGSAREPGRSILVTKDTETVLTGKNKPLGLSMTSTKTEQLKESKKRKAGDNAALMEVGRREMKQVKQNNDYEDQSLTLNRVFQSRRPQKNAPSFENIMIYVDLDQGFRQFVKQEVEEEEEEEDEVQMRLRLLAAKYRLDLPLVADAFSKASCDFDDLEEFLQTGNENLVWTEDEDSDLLEDNKKAIKYLKLLKGNERVQKRKEFLLATL